VENVRLSYRIILKCILEIFFDNNRSQWLVLVNNARVFGGVSTSGLPLILAVVMNCLKFREVKASVFCVDVASIHTFDRNWGLSRMNLDVKTHFTIDQDPCFLRLRLYGFESVCKCNYGRKT